jgi:hypothetical protein
MNATHQQDDPTVLNTSEKFQFLIKRAKESKAQLAEHGYHHPDDLLNTPVETMAENPDPNPTQKKQLDRPPRTLPNGKINPEYNKWRYQKSGGAEALKARRNANPEAYIELRNRWQDKRKKKEYSEMGRVKLHHVKCLECGRIVARETAAVELWRFYVKTGSKSGICNQCY